MERTNACNGRFLGERDRAKKIQRRSQHGIKLRILLFAIRHTVLQTYRYDSSSLALSPEYFESTLRTIYKLICRHFLYGN